MSSRSLNRVTLIGNLTRDPELKYTPSGTAVCTFGLATNRSWTTKTGETKEDVQFHRIVALQKLAELSANLLAKGRKVYLEGRIVYRQFEGKDGQQVNITEIVMDDFVFADSKKAADAGDSSSEGQPEDIPVVDIDEAEAAPTSTASAKKSDTKSDNDNQDTVEPDDIPF